MSEKNYKPRYVIKENGSKIPYEPPKIYKSIVKANKKTKEITSNQSMNELLLSIDTCTQKLGTIESCILKTIVAEKLREHGFINSSKEYLNYKKKGLNSY